MAANIVIVILALLVALSICLIAAGILQGRNARRPTPQHHSAVRTTWWDEIADEKTGWTNGDFVCAAELFEDHAENGFMD